MFHLPPVVGPPVVGSRIASASVGWVSIRRPVALLPPSSTKKRITSMAPPAIDFERVVEEAGVVAFSSLAPAFVGFIVKVKVVEVRVHQVGAVRQGTPFVVTRPAI